MVRVLRAPSRGGESLTDSQPRNEEDDSSSFSFGGDGSGDSDDASLEPSFSFCEDDLIPSDVDRPSDPFIASSSRFQPPLYERDPDRLYSKATDDGVEARITVKRTLVVSEPREQRSTPTTPKIEDSVGDERKGRRVSRSIAALRRRSKSNTRASETRDEAAGDIGPNSNGNANPERLVDVLSRSQSNRSESARRKKSRPPTSRPAEPDVKEGPGLLSRKSSKAAKKPQEPVVAAPQSGKIEQPPPSSSPEQPPSTPMLTSGSSSQVSAPSKNERQTSKIAPLPGTILRRAQQRGFNPIPKRNDELWSAFRSLESDYVKFETKTASVKATFVRTSLLPFLSSYATHRSNDDLPPDDLERRVRILSKWWNGLLDLLQGQAGLQLTGFDRPAVMDGLSGIMERPEWRQPLSEFSPIRKRSKPDTQTPGSQQLGSSEDAEFLLESVHHNTRNLFVYYLFRQMTYVVDKMSLKNVPMSLVTFCGKCCAYAMFFCPGMADVLARLWDVSARNIKRTAESLGLENPLISTQTSELALQAFPRCMHTLAFTSYRSTVVNLRKKPVLPMGFEKIPWRCSWTERWTGKESDLFYVFVRHYHLLLVDFLREDASKEEIAVAPVYILVRAQILSNIDATLRRYEKPVSTEPMDGPAMLSNFNETLNGEGSAFGLSAVPSNAARLIKSNRLIMLMRSFLSEGSAADPAAQSLFAGCVCEALQAAARATSPFDQGACLAICDLLEEYLTILEKFEAHNPTASSSWDWTFWFDVFVRMAQSDNTLIMIRLIALVYTAWPTITKDARRKSELCSKYLLDQAIVLSHFNHWCPMVRSYYMRLLAWRVARCDETATMEDLEIIKTLHVRLLETWCFFKYYVKEIMKQGDEFPSTAPCNPAPGRRMLIIRTDRHIIPSSLVDSPPASRSPSETSGRTEQAETKYWPGPVNGFSAAQLFEKLSLSLDQGADSSKRKSGLFRTISSFRSSESRSPLKDKDSASSTPPAGSLEPAEDSASSEPSSRTSLYEQRPLIPPRSVENQATAGQRGKKVGKEEILAAKGIRLEAMAEFRFSIEGIDRGPTKLPKDLNLSPPRLPHLAQAQVTATPGYDGDPPQQKPTGAGAICVRYSGRALAEWGLVVNECQNFFDRRISEGVSAVKFVETPILSAEPFKRI